MINKSLVLLLIVITVESHANRQLLNKWHDTIRYQYQYHEYHTSFVIHAANIVLEDAIERIFVGNKFGDIPLGVFLVRGENVVLLGEVVCW
jgi:hypothetical protein